MLLRPLRVGQERSEDMALEVKLESIVSHFTLFKLVVVRLFFLLLIVLVLFPFLFFVVLLRRRSNASELCINVRGVEVIDLLLEFFIQLFTMLLIPQDDGIHLGGGFILVEGDFEVPSFATQNGLSIVLIGDVIPNGFPNRGRSK